jgi:hypothetical protein
MLKRIYINEIGEAQNVDHILAISECVKHDERVGRLTICESIELLAMIEKEKRIVVTQQPIYTA